MNRYERHLAEQEEARGQTYLRRGFLTFSFHEDDSGWLEVGDPMGYFEMPPLDWETALSPYCTLFAAEVTETGYKMKNSRTGYMMHFPNSNRADVIEFSRGCHARALERFTQSVMDELGLAPEELQSGDDFESLNVSGLGVDIYPTLVSGDEVGLSLRYSTGRWELTINGDYVGSSDNAKELISEAREITSCPSHSV